MEEMSTPTPRLSIGLPVYNGEAYLEEALESLLGQTYRDFELVISDNASTDRTETICRAYASRDPRVRYVRQEENRGANWNFNEVFRLSRGELFKWASYDDLHDETFIARCVAVLERDAGIVGVHTATAEIGPDGRRIDDREDAYDPAGAASLATGLAAHARFRDVLLNHGWGVRSFGVLRADQLRRTGLYQPAFGWEKIFMAELALMGRFHLIPQRLFLQRVHGASMSQQVIRQGDSRTLQAHYTGGRRLPRMQYVRGYLRAAWRSAPGLGSLAMCIGWILAYVLQVRKWGNVAKSLLPQRSGRVRGAAAAPPANVEVART